MFKQVGVLLFLLINNKINMKVQILKLLAFIIMYGIVLPYLISATDTLLVIVGIIMFVITSYLAYVELKKVLNQ